MRLLTRYIPRKQNDIMDQLSVQTDCADRVVPPPKGLQQDLQNIQEADGGSVCISPLYKATYHAVLVITLS